MTILTILLITIAAISNAVMDKVSHHFSFSVFSNTKYFKEYYWNAGISWKNKYINGDSRLGRKTWKFRCFLCNKVIEITIPVQLTDAWHVMKMIMLVCLLSSIATYEFTSMFRALFDICMFGFIYNTIFSIYYTTLLNKH